MTSKESLWVALAVACHASRHQRHLVDGTCVEVIGSYLQIPSCPIDDFAGNVEVSEMTAGLPEEMHNTP